MYEGGAKIGQIATATNRHRNIITKFLKDPEKYVIRKRRRTIPTISQRTKRHIRLRSIDMMSCSKT